MGSPEEAAVGLCRRSIRIHLSPFMSRPRLCSNPSPPISWPDWHQVSGGGAINCWAGPNPRGWKTPLVNLQEPHLPHNSREIKTWKSHELIFLYFIGFFHMTNFVSTKCVYVTYQPATKKKKKNLCVTYQNFIVSSVKNSMYLPVSFIASGHICLVHYSEGRSMSNHEKGQSSLFFILRAY